MKILAKMLIITIFSIINIGLIIPATVDASNKNTEKTNTDNKESTDCPGGICATTESLANGTAKMNIYETLGMGHKSKTGGDETSVMTFLQDIIYAATYFIGTVVAAALILSGFFYVYSGANSNLRTRAKSGLKNSLIGLVLVTLSVIIIRAIQFLAQGGS